MKYLIYIVVSLIVSILIGVSSANAQEANNGERPTFGKELSSHVVPLNAELYDLDKVGSNSPITFGKDKETKSIQLPLKEEYKERLKAQTRTMKFTKEAETKKVQLTSK